MAISSFSLLPSNLLPPPRLSTSSSPFLPFSTTAFSSFPLLAAGAALAGALTLPPAAAAAALPEPANALSLPTWAVHISSVVEWITAMVLVWEYGERSGFERWKGLSWGMVPLLGGATCACTWHFFYNSESLEVLVAIQGALTAIGNLTMCIAAYRILKAAQEDSQKN